MIRETLTKTVESWEKLGHPALLERFVLRNGREFTPTKRVGCKMKPKQCFNNATDFVLCTGGSYVEGYVFKKKDGFLHVLHAWVTLDGVSTMDPTLDSEEYEYIGVVFDVAVLRRELVRNKVYGLLDPGLGVNFELMFKMDPELKNIFNSIRQRRRA